jgi:hypothetical protein
MHPTATKARAQAVAHRLAIRVLVEGIPVFDKSRMVS